MARQRSRTASLRDQSRSGLFADSGFWVALLLRRDALHKLAAAWQRWIETNGVPVVTTEAVLWESLNHLSPVGLRQTALELFHRCHAASDITVVPFQKSETQAAINLYGSRRDKSWSLTDCHSFVVMDDLGLEGALTADHHYEQAGYRALLLEDPPE